MKVERIAGVFVLSFFLTACGAARVATQPAVVFSTPLSLVVLGDSISVGQYLPASTDAFPYVLAADLHAQLTVYAASGHTTAQTRSMYTGALSPTYAVIELGTNDYNHSIPLAIFAAAYHSVVTSIAPTTRAVCLSVWDPVSTNDTIWSSPHIPSPVNHVDATPTAYNTIIMQSCQGKYLSIQSIYDTASCHGSGTNGSLYHPNVAGTTAIAQLIYAVL
ncbi:MAG TPA: SGNH/GDSL hydrolase family protein [Ktedonobacteraceae bacterium]|nr:SGNH/GDSL hydrolase family protein [Ktedonobacteraceae bacterium]